jgi:hypothetical protein
MIKVPRRPSQYINLHWLWKFTNSHALKPRVRCGNALVSSGNAQRDERDVGTKPRFTVVRRVA